MAASNRKFMKQVKLETFPIKELLLSFMAFSLDMET